MNFQAIKDSLFIVILATGLSISAAAQEKEQKKPSHLFEAMDIFELEYATHFFLGFWPYRVVVPRVERNKIGVESR